MQLKGIYIYPIKSISGLALQEAYAGERGFDLDRRWMLIDEHNTFITQRKYHNLALVRMQLEGENMVLTQEANGFGSVKIPLKIQGGEKIKSAVWDDHVDLLWPNHEADAWFSEMLKSKVRLVFMPGESKRQIDPKYVPETMNTSLSDGYPYLLANQTSVDDVSKKAGEIMEMERFRPSLVVETTHPFEEDQWNRIEIGQVKFRIVKPCARCVLTTIDPQTGIAGKEPLKTLSTYRKIDGKILFGQNVIAESHGIIRVGDEILLK